MADRHLGLFDPTGCGDGRQLAAWGGGLNRLDLNGLTQLDVATADKLAAWGGRTLSLDGLTPEDRGRFKQLRRDKK